MHKTATMFAVLLSALFMWGGCHQPSRNATDRLVIGEVMTGSEFTQNLRALCEPGGRLSGTPSALKAAQFVADKAREYGLKNVHLEPFEMPGWRSDSVTVTLLTEPPIMLEGAIALMNTEATPPGGVTADLIDLGQGADEDFERVGETLRGKFGLLSAGKRHRRAKMELAVKHGAAGLLFPSRPEREPIIGGCHRTPRPEPAIVIRHADAQDLAARLAAGEHVRVSVNVEAEVWDATAQNVVADIPGSGPLADEMVILTAHLDSWHLAEGALDNGAGSMSILEAARALAALDWRPRRTVRFIWVMGEEQGLYGSKAYVAAHRSELKSVPAMVNVDMPGSPRSFAHSGSESVDAILESLRARLPGYELAEKFGELGGMWSDHGPFVAAGVCGICVSGDQGPGVKHYHTTGDTYDSVDRRASIEAAAVLGVLMRSLADGDFSADAGT